MEIGMITGTTGIGKTHIIKPLSEYDDKVMYIDLIASGAITINPGNEILVLDHIGFDNELLARLLAEATELGYKTTLLVGQDLRDIDFQIVKLDWSIEFLGGWKNLLVKVTKDDHSHTYTREELNSINKLIH